MKFLKEIAWACFKCYNLQFPLSILKLFVGVSGNFYFKYCNTSPLMEVFEKKIGFRKLIFFQNELTFTKNGLRCSKSIIMVFEEFRTTP